MKKTILAALLFTGCVTDETEARKTLVKAGFTEIQVGDAILFQCSEDKVGREFSAVSSQGILIQGVVCCGVFRRCIVRF